MKKKNQKRNDALKLRSAIETLSFQTDWGLKKLGVEDDEKYGELSKAEVGYITELGLVQDILSIKDLVDGIRKEFQVEPCVELGDFCNSLVTIALGIGRVEDLHNMGLPSDWKELMQKKLLKIYYPEEVRNKIFEWARTNGYNTSTYLGQPIVKFNKLFILLERNL
jgi:hypothetical protein